ncbi:DoxX family protein [Peribacillus sp. AS_2]|uniref:DoxX family protein n=1 Tax=Peribacillus sp. AS_2 TaxID=2996755 RepID=UPI0022A74858|nr:DoxX family protein [Peribacillus sp. AS_2]MCZ0872702.1 DoxX family protein [Peribacillus sp. AS_2]
MSYNVFLFLCFGSRYVKVDGGKQQVEIFKELNLPKWLRIVTGLIELFGAISLVIGFYDGKFVAIGGLILGLTMIGATAIHFLIKDPLNKTIPPLIFALLSLLLTFTHLEYLLNLFN